MSHVDTFVPSSKFSVVYHHSNFFHHCTGSPNVLTFTFHSSTHHDNTPIITQVHQFASRVKTLVLGESLKQRTGNPKVPLDCVQK